MHINFVKIRTGNYNVYGAVHFIILMEHVMSHKIHYSDLLWINNIFHIINKWFIKHFLLCA